MSSNQEMRRSLPTTGQATDNCNPQQSSPTMADRRPPVSLTQPEHAAESSDTNNNHSDRKPGGGFLDLKTTLLLASERLSKIKAATS